MLLAPLALILAILAIPIILMYVLKLRRQEYVVPSTFLWRQALEDVQANAPWQRLRFNILLLLQLLALTVLILALARPAYSSSHVIAGDLVLIVDESYGMQAHDVSPSRFAAALERAHTLASEVGNGNVVSVIGMGAHPHLAIAESGDGGAVVRAIDGLRVGVSQPNFGEALSLAASLARSGQDTHVVVLTSRDSGIVSLPVNVAFPVDIVRIGGRLHDLGITAFSAVQQSSAVEAVARVGNFGSGTATSDLELFVDGNLADVRPLTIAAHHTQNLFWTQLPLATHRLRVLLTHADDVTSDKSAWAVVPSEPTRRILLVSSGDFFLQTAILDEPSIKLTLVPPLAYTPGMERSYDLVIFDGVLPPALPAASTLLVAPPRGSMGSLRFSSSPKALPGGAVTQAPSAAAGPTASLLKYVDLSDVHVAQVSSSPKALPGWLQPLAVSNGHTVLAAGERGSIRYALVNFALQRSDWPLRISFPIMLENMVHYLAPGLTLGQTDVATGGAVTFFPAPGTRELAVVQPDGATGFLKPPFPPFTNTSKPGLYTVKAVTDRGSDSASFAVNFFPARPAPAPGSSVLHLGHVQAGKTLIASVPVSLAWAFELLALAFLGAEWWIAFRGSGRS